MGGTYTIPPFSDGLGTTSPLGQEPQQHCSLNSKTILPARIFYKPLTGPDTSQTLCPALFTALTSKMYEDFEVAAV